MSKIVSRLQNSLTESKASGLLLDRVVHCDRYCAVHLEVELEQANLLDQACFGCHIVTAYGTEQCHEEHTTSDTGIETFCDAIHHVQRSPHYHFNKFSVRQNLTLTSPSPMMVDLNTRWKGKGSKAIALANPMSKIVAQLQSSLSQSKACGLLAGLAVLLQVGIEQADLLNRVCFGHPIITHK
ncbi:hypothetical protein IFM89_021054 [Coptis chinensis]|uniref:Uncharacterized protein n=1 Tax=Coptis chinensis TaxID=261450 RepID=A0A835H820_9MAGN|nr:hypothetical protein IFM89_021054 [Coptis chinensis]